MLLPSKTRITLDLSQLDLLQTSELVCKGCRVMQDACHIAAMSGRRVRELIRLSSLISCLPLCRANKGRTFKSEICSWRRRGRLPDVNNFYLSVAGRLRSAPARWYASGMATRSRVSLFLSLSEPLRTANSGLNVSEF